MNKRIFSIFAAFVMLVSCVYIPVGAAQTKASSSVKVVSSFSAKASAYNAIKLSWKVVSKADGYVISRAESKKGSYKDVKTIKDGSTVSWTDKSVVCGKAYYYKIRAYAKGKYSDYSSIVSAQTSLSVPSIKLSAGTTSIKLTWGKASGAVGYQIYRKDSSGGDYVKIKTVTGTSYSDSGLKSSHKYYYKVRAYIKTNNGNVYSKYSATVSASTKAKTSSSGTVYWTPSGKSYHSTKDCATLKRSKTISKGSVSEAKASGHKDPCNVCVK